MKKPTSQSTNSAAACWAARILALLALGIVLGHLAACGGGGDDTAVPTPAVDCKAAPEQCR